jgi:hypothetical protein
MADKVACTKCGASDLTHTAENGGLCMPCETGTRERIDAGRRWHEERGEREPSRALWLSLVDRVHNTPSGFAGLSGPEKIYYSVVLMEGEVYNGGFDQYFFNRAAHCRKGLLEINKAMGTSAGRSWMNHSGQSGG